jgi:hypothetical protein
MKSVTLVAFIGSWFCSSLTSKVRKSCELSVLRAASLDVAVEEDVDVEEFVAGTVMTNSGSPLASRNASQRLIVDHLQIKRTERGIQAHNHSAELFD